MKERKREILGVEATVADTFLQRLLGLMFRRDLPEGQGLLITRCRSIHTLFMRFHIDAVFLDADGAIVRIVRDIPTWRPFVWGGRSAVQVLETRCGAVESAPDRDPSTRIKRD
jgi:uncharacterized membrane protein (UPF0127 family)